MTSYVTILLVLIKFDYIDEEQQLFYEILLVINCHLRYFYRMKSQKRKLIVNQTLQKKYFIFFDLLLSIDF